MTHEFKKIVENYIKTSQKGLKSVLATVVKLDGSSYRRPGVRMLISEDGQMTGAVSGGCVEKEVLRQAQSVFSDGAPKMMTYDGRYRLGCEGILYILLEPFNVDQNFVANFKRNLKSRAPFSIQSYFALSENNSKMGSVIKFEDGTSLPFSSAFNPEIDPKSEVFKQDMSPAFKLLIIGSEHDAVQLCITAAQLGWEVTIVSSPKDPKTLLNFPGAEEILNVIPEELPTSKIDEETAIILMNHNYALDLKFLTFLKDTLPAYIGLLGPSRRREKLLNEFMEYCPEVSFDFFDSVHGPSGLNIGAETPQEIAVSIVSEILATIRKQDPIALKDKSGAIHT
ncbi:XdhC family protein [Leeuwenhoekiella sp. A16]|uniref:XdhC family protein n=1 Tax=Leeuwenhoekiella sp. A16 TaxID=3141462 RepID=UPI003A7F8472